MSVTPIDQAWWWRFLWPLRVLLSFSYGPVMAWRNTLYDRGLGVCHVNVPVISVGNITVGGTGKTPLVAMLARQLQQQGKRVAILSRGYKGVRSNKQICVSDGVSVHMSAQEAGDEAVMLARQLPGVAVYVSVRRYRAAQHICATYRPDIILLDDGFQHRRLYRDKDIVVWDSLKPVQGQHLLPWGYLREPLSQLSRASVVVLSKTNFASPQQLKDAEHHLQRYAPAAKFVRACYRPRCWFNLSKKTNHSLDMLKNHKAIVVCGIGQPESFIQQVQDLHVDVADVFVFPDHYFFTAKDLQNIRGKMNLCGATVVVCTEKDSVRWPQQDPIVCYALLMDAVVNDEVV